MMQLWFTPLVSSTVTVPSTIQTCDGSCPTSTTACCPPIHPVPLNVAPVQSYLPLIKVETEMPETIMSDEGWELGLVKNIRINGCFFSKLF